MHACLASYTGLLLSMQLWIIFKTKRFFFTILRSYFSLSVCRKSDQFINLELYLMVHLYFVFPITHSKRQSKVDLVRTISQQKSLASRISSPLDPYFKSPYCLLYVIPILICSWYVKWRFDKENWFLECSISHVKEIALGFGAHISAII